MEDYFKKSYVHKAYENVTLVVKILNNLNIHPYSIILKIYTVEKHVMMWKMFYSRLYYEKSSFKTHVEYGHILYTYAHSPKEYIKIFQQIHAKVILLKMIFFISFFQFFIVIKHTLHSLLSVKCTV